jgi:hypothetical protein
MRRLLEKRSDATLYCNIENLAVFIRSSRLILVQIALLMKPHKVDTWNKRPKSDGSRSTFIDTKNKPKTQK